MSLALPNELWLWIFRAATSVPGSLEIDHEDPFDHTSALANTALANPTNTLYPLLQASRHTQRSLILVCKRWHTLSLPLLYESLYVPRLDVIAQLSRRLLASRNEAEQSNDGRKPLGSWTLRLDLAMTDMPNPSQYYTGVHDWKGGVNPLLDLETLFICLPNLRILGIHCLSPSRIRGAKPHRIPERAWRALLSTCSDSLLKFDHDQSGMLVPPDDSGRRERALLSSFRRLRTVNFRSKTWCSPGAIVLGQSSQECELCANDYPSVVSCLDLSGPAYQYCTYKDDHQHRPFPRVTMVYIILVRQNMEALLRLLSYLGDQLTTILLSGFTGGHHGFVNRLFASLKIHCPNLTRVILVPQLGMTFKRHDAEALYQALPATITHLGVLLDPQLYNDSRGPLLKRVIQWLSRDILERSSTSLRLIRLFSTDHLSWERSVVDEPEWHKARSSIGTSLALFERCGIRVEGFDGQEMKTRETKVKLLLPT